MGRGLHAVRTAEASAVRPTAGCQSGVRVCLPDPRSRARLGQRLEPSTSNSADMRSTACHCEPWLGAKPVAKRGNRPVYEAATSEPSEPAFVNSGFSRSVDCSCYHMVSPMILAGGYCNGNKSGMGSGQETMGKQVLRMRSNGEEARQPGQSAFEGPFQRRVAASPHVSELAPEI